MRRALLGVVLALVVAVVLGGCRGEDRPGRRLYNKALAALAAGELDQAEKDLLVALDQAELDDDLRFRANFNLATVAARRAEAAATGQPKKVDRALAEYRRAMSWLGDASRIRPDDGDTRANLERVQARMLAIVDEANRGANSLERRLDAAIDGQRTLRDLARKLWAAQDARGAGADPLADRDGFEAAAARQRNLGTETGVIADLAGDEITAIGGKPEDERTDQEKVRVVQLQNLDLYIQDARKDMVDARRNLHDLRGELAHGRSEAALAALKRAREQLLDPVAVLQGVAGDQLQTAQLTAALDQLTRGARIGEDGAPPPGPPPAWLSTGTLAGDQQALKARLEEVKARFGAGLGAPDAPAPDPAADPQAAAQAAEQAQVRALIATAMPALDEATAAMTRAGDALAAGDAARALLAQRDALLAMSRAIELFLQLRKLIDVTLAEQRAVVAALSPPAAGKAAITAAERAKIVGEGTARNRDRLLRMQGLIAGEKAGAVAQAEAQAQAAAQGGTPPEGAQDPAQAGALYDQLEALRAQAGAAVDELAAVAAGGKGEALTSAKAAEARLVEMQQLLFSVTEHLQELIRAQGETREQTAKTELEDDAGRAPLLPGLIDRQAQHAQLADAIAQALARQADAASQGGAGGGGQGALSPQAFAEAAGEVRNGRTSMQDASDTLVKARDQAGAMSYNLQPVLEDQKQAKEHLENALRLLQPPKQQQQGGDQQQDQDQGGDQQQDPDQGDQQPGDDQQPGGDQRPQDQQPGGDQQQDPGQPGQQDQQQAPDKQQSAEEAERRLQRVREREAQRQREQQERQRTTTEPVERDW